MADDTPKLRERIEALSRWLTQIQNARAEGVPEADIKNALLRKGFSNVEQLEQRLAALQRTVDSADRDAGRAPVTRGDAAKMALQQGTTFGFWDEAFVPEAEREQYRARLGEAQDAYPGTSLGMEVAGALGPGVLSGAGLLTLARALPLGGRMLAGAALGGLEGLLGGAGRATGSVRERVSAAAPTAGISAAAGFALPPLGAVASPLTSRFQTAEDALERMTGAVPRQTLEAMPAELGALQRSVAPGVPAGAPNPVRVADTEAGQTLSRLAVTGDPAGAGQTLERALGGRVRESGSNLERLLEATTGSAPRLSTAELRAASQVERRQIAREVYGPLERAYPLTEQGEVIAEQLVTDLMGLGDETLGRIWNGARRVARLQETPLRTIVRRNAQGQIERTTEIPDFQTLQALQTSLRDLQESAFANGKGGLGRGYALQRERVERAMRDIWPDQYEEAQTAYRNATRAVEAAELGPKLWSDNADVRDIENWLAQAPEQAREVYRTSALNELRRQLVSRRGNPVLYLSSMRPDKLRLVLNEDEYGALTDALQTWRRVVRTGQYVSSTARSQTADLQQLLQNSGLRSTNPAGRTLVGTLWEAIQPQGLSKGQLEGVRRMGEMLTQEAVDPGLLNRRRFPTPGGLLRTGLTGTLIPWLMHPAQGEETGLR